MQIIGNELIKFEPLCFVEFITADLKGRNLLFNFNKDLIKVALELDCKFSLICDDISQAILANALNAKFIVCNKSKAEKFSDLAQFYLFDSKIACIIDSENELNELAKLRVDTAIFKKGIVNGIF